MFIKPFSIHRVILSDLKILGVSMEDIQNFFELHP